MSFHSTIPSFALDTNANANGTSSCLQDAQEQTSLCQWIFILGALLPVIIWPLLPSTSEVVNYRILAFSSLAQLVSEFHWSAYAATTDTDDALPFSFHRTWVALIGPLLCCCFTFGIIGHSADKYGKRLVRESFDTPTHITVGMLPQVVPMLGEYFFNKSSTIYILVAYMLMAIALKHGTELVMTTYYHFITRRISSLYWLPQNESKADFNPWWSRSLRCIWVAYTLLLVYVSLATACFARECQLQLGQPPPTNGYLTWAIGKVNTSSTR